MSKIEARTRGSVESLRLLDFSDKEIAAIVADVREVDGWASRTAIANVIFPFVGNGNAKRAKHAIRCVAIRLAWLRRYGVVEKMPVEEQRHADRDANDSFWGLTAEGETFLRGRLTVQQERLLRSVGDDRLVQVVATITDRYVGAHQTAAHLLRREWLYGISRRSR